MSMGSALKETSPLGHSTICFWMKNIKVYASLSHYKNGFGRIKKANAQSNIQLHLIGPM